MYKHQHFEDLLSLEVQVHNNEDFTVGVHHFQTNHQQRTFDKVNFLRRQGYSFNQKLKLSTIQLYLIKTLKVTFNTNII